MSLGHSGPQICWTYTEQVAPGSSQGAGEKRGEGSVRRGSCGRGTHLLLLGPAHLRFLPRGRRSRGWGSPRLELRPRSDWPLASALQASSAPGP